MDAGNNKRDKARPPKDKTRVYSREDDGKMMCISAGCGDQSGQLTILTKLATLNFETGQKF